MNTAYIVRCAGYIVLLSLIYTSELLLPESWLSFLYSALILLVGVIEIAQLIQTDKAKFFLSPAVLCSIYVFVFAYGITNYLYFYSEKSRDELFYYLGPQAIKYLNEVLLYVNIAHICMWLGYKSNQLARYLFDIITYIFNLKNILRKDFIVNISTLWTLYSISLLTRGYLIIVGGYGYAAGLSTASSVAAEYNEILILLSSSLSKLCLLVFAMYDYKYLNKLSLRALIVILVELLLGLLYGFKSALVYPILIVTLAYLITHQDVSRRFIVRSAVLIILAINVSYFLIEPFRQLLVNSTSGSSSGFDYLTTSLVQSYGTTTQASDANNLGTGNSDTFEAFMARINLTMWTGVALANMTDATEFTEQARMKEKLLLVPLLAYAPRAIWPDKPERNEGVLFYKLVLRMESDSTSFTPGTIGYLFLGFGFAGIVVPVFFLVGILQRLVYLFFLKGGGGIILFIGLLQPVVFIDEFTYSLIPFFKELPLLIFLQYVLLNKK